MKIPQIDMTQEINACHWILDRAGVPDMFDDDKRLLERVSWLANKVTMGASELDKTMQDLERILTELSDSVDIID